MYENPYTLKVIGEEKFLDKKEVKSRVELARGAQIENARRTLDERKALVDNIVQYLKANKETMAKEVTEMIGKPIT